MPTSSPGIARIFCTTPISKTFARSGSTGSLIGTAVSAYGGGGWRRDKRQIDRGRYHLSRRREVSCVADVERGIVGRLPGQADARTELVGIDILIHLVEPQTCVQRQLVGDLPFVLKIGADQPAGLGAGIEDGERRTERSAGYRVGLIAGHGIDRQYLGYVGDQ